MLKKPKCWTEIISAADFIENLVMEGYLIKGMKRILLILLLLSIFTISGYGAGSELFREAEGRYGSGNYYAAFDLYTRFITENRISPNVPDAQFKRAVCLYQLGRSEEAFDLFEKVRQKYTLTKYIDAVPFWQGRISLEFEEFENAAAYFDEYIRDGKSGQVVEAYLYRALSYDNLCLTADAAYSLELLLDKEDFEDDGYITALLASLYLKESRFSAILELSDEEPPESFLPEYRNQLMLYRAEALYGSGDLAGAEKIYKELSENDGQETAAAWQRLFIIYKKLGKEKKLESLLAEAERSIKGRPGILRDFRTRIGIASYNAADYEAAEKYLLSVWDTSSPADMDGVVPLYYSKILERNNSSRRAIEILEAFIAESNSRKAEILVRLSELYSASGDYDKAEQHLDEFFADYSETDFYYEAAYLKSFICYENKRVEEALDWVAEAYSADDRGERTSSLLRLESTLLKRAGDYSAAADKLKRYLTYKPDDTGAVLDLFRLKFMLEEYDKILVDSVDFKWRPDVREDDEKSYLLVSYITGLSAILLSDYKRAVDELSLISTVNSEEAGITDIYPYALFYKGWSLYRLTKYSAASRAFEEMLEGFSDSDKAHEAAYLAGWCEYILADYERSSTFFLKYMSLTEEDSRGRFMYAKNLTAMERYREAAEIFAEISREDEKSPLADDALFERAALYALMGDPSAAADDYEYLFNKYGGKLGEEGMFRRGELYYGEGDFAASASAYYDFRRNYPESSLYDAALYWGGVSLNENDEGFGAALLWENIIKDYRDSVFRAPAMLKTAEVYAAAGDYSAALEMYERCRLEYPSSERAATAAYESEKLRLLIGGLSEREAELNVIITREGGAGSSEGRRAMIELSALYISMGGSELKPAISMLEQITEHRDEDPEAAADAKFYIGEYYYRKNNYPDAVKAFLEAAVINPDDRDSSARALYRAADTAVYAESYDDAKQLVKRLKDFYPGTEWAIEADKLLKGVE